MRTALALIPRILLEALIALSGEIIPAPPVVYQPGTTNPQTPPPPVNTGIDAPTVIVITDRSTPTDTFNWYTDVYHWWYGAPIDTGINGPQSLVNDLQQYKDGSIHYLVLIGHGLLLEAGVQASGGSLYYGNFTPDRLAAIKAKLAPDATIELVRCQLGLNVESMQRLSNALGRNVTATTGGVSGGNTSDTGLWVTTYPKSPSSNPQAPTSNP